MPGRKGEDAASDGNGTKPTCGSDPAPYAPFSARQNRRSLRPVWQPARRRDEGSDRYAGFILMGSLNMVKKGVRDPESDIKRMLSEVLFLTLRAGSLRIDSY